MKKTIYLSYAMFCGSEHGILYLRFYEIWIPRGEVLVLLLSDILHVCVCAPRHLVEVWARLVVTVSGTS